MDEPVTAETVKALRQVTAAQALVPLNRYGRWARGAWTLALGESATKGLFHSVALRRHVRAWAQEVRFDAVFAFCSSMVQYAESPQLARVPLIVDLVDVDSQKWLDYAAGARGCKRWLFQREAAAVRRMERSLPARARAIALVSDAEAALYRSFCPNDQTHGIMNGVDLDYFRDDFPVSEKRPDQCVFVGVLDYRANVESLVWFCREVWPLVLAHKPEAKFAIVGKNPTAAVRAMGQLPGVRVVGPAPDVRPYIAESRIVVAPLRIARGIQNKVLEAMAMGKPVVATPQASEGLKVESGVHLLRAASAQEQCDALLRLYQDEELVSRIGSSARHYATENHSWPACLTALDVIFDSVSQVQSPAREMALCSTGLPA